MKGESAFGYEWNEETKQLFIYPLVVSEEMECLVADEGNVRRISLPDEQAARDYIREFGRVNGVVEDLNPRIN